MRESGWRLIWARDTSEALKAFYEAPVSVVLTESVNGSPDIYEICSHIKRVSDVPIIFLSKNAREIDKVKAFEAGADDYLTKPFSWRELVARIRASLRRSTSNGLRIGDGGPEVYKFGSLEVNVDARRVLLDGQDTRVTQTEFRLLLLFIRNTGKVLSHSFILTTIWGTAYADDREYVRAYVYRLRRKLEAAGGDSPFFVSIPGIGYMFTGGVPITDERVGWVNPAV